MKKTLPVVRRNICIQGQTIEFEWTRKPIKNMNLRVRSNGSVTVSTPLKTTFAQTEAFLFAHASFLLSAMERFQQRREAGLPPCTFQTGDRLFVFGEETTVLICPGKQAGGRLCNGKLILTVAEPENRLQRYHAAEIWAREAFQPVLEPLCRKAEADFAEYHISKPDIRVRKMRSMWGNCHVQKAKLTFNPALIGAPLQAVEYVVYHEFAHLVHPNHSPRFYATVAQFLPDWKARKSLLQNIPCNLFST